MKDHCTVIHAGYRFSLSQRELLRPITRSRGQAHWGSVWRQLRTMHRAGPSAHSTLLASDDCNVGQMHSCVIREGFTNHICGQLAHATKVNLCEHLAMPLRVDDPNQVVRVSSASMKAFPDRMR